MLKSHNIKKGFTIIEVIIVLVIAAIIMLAVFLVVPQLQQNQRNTRRQQYARQLVTAVTQWYANNPNTDPTAANLTAIAGVQQDPSTPGTDYNIAAPSQTAAAVATTAGLGNIAIRTGISTCTNNTFATGNGVAVMMRQEGAPLTFCVTDGR